MVGPFQGRQGPVSGTWRLSLVRALVQAPSLQGAAVIMTSRDLARGEEVLQQLRVELGEEEGARVELLQLDITDQASVDSLARRVREEHGGLDVLAIEVLSVANFTWLYLKGKIGTKGGAGRS